MNIDAQDAQDNQDRRLLQETLTRAMIVCGFEDVREHKPAVSGKNPVHPVHRCESKIYPCLTMNRFPATRRKRLFQVSHHSRKNDRSLVKTNHEWTRMNTNRHEGWTSFNDNWRQNTSALLSRWCDPVMGGSPPGSAGVPPAQILPQLQPSPPPESSFGRAHAVPAGRAVGCNIAGKLSGRRDSMRAGRPRSRGCRLERWGVSGGRLL